MPGKGPQTNVEKTNVEKTNIALCDVTAAAVLYERCTDVLTPFSRIFPKHASNKGWEYIRTRARRHDTQIKKWKK